MSVWNDTYQKALAKAKAEGKDTSALPATWQPRGLGDFGRFAQTAGTLAPLVIPGVGLVAGAAIGAGANALGGGNVLEGAAKGAAAAGANQALLGGQGAAGVSNLLNTGSVNPGVLARAKSLIAAGASPASVASSLGMSPTSLSSLLSTGLGIAGAVTSAEKQGEADALRKQGLAQVQPGVVKTPDLSAVYANPGNPYSRAAVRPPATGPSALEAARASLRGY